MSKYECRVERHSKSAHSELITLVWTFPRIILAEAVTHRRNSDTWGEFTICERTTTQDMSKNSASSRAIPHDRRITQVHDDPFVPVFTMDQKGMQGPVCDDPDLVKELKQEWIYAAEIAAYHAAELAKCGVHKQVVNRLIEPFTWVTQIVTATREAWNNWWALRTDEGADPHIALLAKLSYLKVLDSTPDELQPGQWHLPFTSKYAEASFSWRPESFKDANELPFALKESAARCAWLSYENHDKDGSAEAVERTFNRLIVSRPVHASPLEHQATPCETPFNARGGNFGTAWVQARKLVPFESVKEFSPPAEDLEKWRDELKSRGVADV